MFALFEAARLISHRQLRLPRVQSPPAQSEERKHKHEYRKYFDQNSTL